MLKPMSPLTSPVLPGLTVMFRARFAPSTDMVLPLPVAVTPLIVPAMSVPVETVAAVPAALSMAAGNVVPLSMVTCTLAVEPYPPVLLALVVSLEVSSSVLTAAVVA